MKRYYFLSVAAHVGVLILAAMLASNPGGEGGEGNNNAEGGEQQTKFIPKLVEVELVMSSELGEGDGPPAPPPVKAERACLNNLWYGGIGIQSGFTGKIESVAPGYAADRAGVKLGDMVTSKGEIRGEPGTQVTINVFRPSTGETFTLTLTREKICYEE